MYKRPDAMYTAPTADAMYKTPHSLSLSLALTFLNPTTYTSHHTRLSAWCTQACMGGGHVRLSG
jgi:hypothetical protein